MSRASWFARRALAAAGATREVSIVPSRLVASAVVGTGRFAAVEVASRIGDLGKSIHARATIIGSVVAASAEVARVSFELVLALAVAAGTDVSGNTHSVAVAIVVDGADSVAGGVTGVSRKARIAIGCRVVRPRADITETG